MVLGYVDQTKTYMWFESQPVEEMLTKPKQKY